MTRAHTSTLPPADLARAERLATETGEAVEIVASRLGRLSEDDLATAQAAALGLEGQAPSTFPTRRSSPTRRPRSSSAHPGAGTQDRLPR